MRPQQRQRLRSALAPVLAALCAVSLVVGVRNGSWPWLTVCAASFAMLLLATE